MWSRETTCGDAKGVDGVNHAAAASGLILDVTIFPTDLTQGSVVNDAAGGMPPSSPEWQTHRMRMSAEAEYGDLQNEAE